MKRSVLGVLVLSLVVVAAAGILTTLGAQAPQPAQAAPAAQAQRGQRGPAVPPAPCGPNLPATTSKNVAPTSRCFELRMYTADAARDGVGAFKGGINELHQRFREKEVAIFQKHGAEIVAVWQDLGEPNRLIWMLAYRDRAHREAVWAAFNADPEWTELRLKYNVPLQPPNVTFMSAADYSPLK